MAARARVICTIADNNDDHKKSDEKPMVLELLPVDYLKAKRARTASITNSISIPARKTSEVECKKKKYK